METPRFTQVRHTFSLECAVEVTILATATVLWAILTDAPAFPRWNSTVSSIEGAIREGARLRLHVPGTSRTFTPTVTGVVANERMTWTGGFTPFFKGLRTCCCPWSNAPCRTSVRCSEPYANDLKREAERVSS